MTSLVSPGLSARAWTPAPVQAWPDASAKPPLMWATPRVSDFRRVHHYHVVPGPMRLLGWTDPSRTGDHYAISRYNAAFSLQFDKLARIIGIFPAHIALASVVGLLWGFGVRQGIHSMMLTSRALRAMNVQTATIETARKQLYRNETPVHMQALARRNRHVKWSMRYGMLLDASATLGSAALGVGTLFRLPLLGEFAHVLSVAAIPVLTGAFVPLALPSAIGSVERTARAALAFHKINAIKRHTSQVDDPRALQVNKLYRHRQHELARYFVTDALCRAGLVMGATVSVFVGPGGLLLLVPASVGLIVSECFAGRMVNVDDTFPLQERLTMRTDADYFAAISTANCDATSLKSLRRVRHDRYPRGWGTFCRPLLRLYRRMSGNEKSDTEMSAKVLAAFDRRDTQVDPARDTMPDPPHLMNILDDGRVREAFAEALLYDKKLRRALRGHGVTLIGRKWSVDADVLAMHMMETRWNAQWSQQTVDALYRLAEEVLLTRGRVEHVRRLRALLDYYGRFARATLRQSRAHQRVARHRRDS